MHISKLKTKIIILLLTSIGGSMLLAGLTLSYFIQRQYQKESRQTFSSFHQDAKTGLQSLEEKLLTSARSLALDATLISSINLVSEYIDINNYQPLIFDKEKWTVAEQLARFSRAANVDHVRIHDKHGWLISFVDNQPQHLEQGILTFNNSKPEYITKSLLTNLLSNTPKDSHWKNLYQEKFMAPGGVVRYIRDINNTIYLQASYPITRTFADGASKYIGRIFIAKRLDVELLLNMSNTKNIHHILTLTPEQELTTDPGINPNDYLNNVPDFFAAANSKTPSLITSSDNHTYVHSIRLSDKSLFYIISVLDRTAVKTQIKSTLFLVFVIFLISSLIMLLIFLIFTRRTITRPLDNLLEHAAELSSGNYDISAMTSGTREFDTLSAALCSAAATINSREHELRTANIDMEVRVQQRTADLSKTNKELAAEIAVREAFEEQLRESKAMLSTIMDNIPQFIFWKDTEYKYLGCNKNFTELTGNEKEEDIIGKTDYDMPWTNEEADFYRKCDQRVMQSDTAEFHIQETITDEQGKITYVDTNKIPLHDANGNVMGILGTFEDISERKKAELDLMQAKEIAETANSAKSDFLSRMSHELRTPLNAILGFAQLLEYDINHPMDSEQKESVKEILTAGNHLLELINDILDLSKIETGKLSLNLKPTHLGKVIADAHSLVRNFAQQKKVTLLFPSPETINFTVRADNVRLKQTLLNLLSNAIKYNAAGGKVTLSVDPLSHSYIKVSIKDTGVGINAKYHKRVFTPFDRLDADARAFDGTGIGLVISKQLVELMKGEIGFTSTPGAGTTFWFTLPLSQSPETDSHTDSNCNLLAAEVKKHDKRLLLCIEDNEANKRLIENIITSKTPHDIITVSTAEEGIELLQSITPDVILMDITLPGMNGIEATRIIRQNKDFKTTPIIAISANAMVDDIKQGLNGGFDDYLTKPIDLTAFMATVLNYLH